MVPLERSKKIDQTGKVEAMSRVQRKGGVHSNDSYERMFDFGQKHLNDLFVLDGIQSVSARDAILREIISNSLAHRDYSNAYIAKMIIGKDKIVVENGNRAHGIGALNIIKGGELDIPLIMERFIETQKYIRKLNDEGAEKKFIEEEGREKFHRSSMV